MRVRFLPSGISQMSYAACTIASGTAPPKQRSRRVSPLRVMSPKLKSTRPQPRRSSERLPKVVRVGKSQLTRRIAKLRCVSDIRALSLRCVAAAGGVAVAGFGATPRQQPRSPKKQLPTRLEKKSKAKKHNRVRHGRLTLAGIFDAGAGPTSADPTSEE